MVYQGTAILTCASDWENMQKKNYNCSSNKPIEANWI